MTYAEHTDEMSEYAPEECEQCANSYGPCFRSQVLRAVREGKATVVWTPEQGWKP